MAPADPPALARWRDELGGYEGAEARSAEEIDVAAAALEELLSSGLAS
jgi:hypothetical protein